MTKVLTIRLDEELYKKTEIIAKNLNRSKNWVIREVLERYLEDMFDIEEAKDYTPPAPKPDPIQQKKTRLQEILSKKDLIKKAIGDGLITSDDEVVKRLIQEAKALIKELKEAGENPFD